MENNHTALLKEAYDLWSANDPDSVKHWLGLMDDNVQMGSLADGAEGMEFTRSCGCKTDVARYFSELASDWTLHSYDVDEFIAQGDRVVMLGRCKWEHRRTHKGVDTPKVDIFRFKNGMIVELFEFYDTAKALAATVPDKPSEMMETRLKQHCSELLENIIIAVDNFPWERRDAYANYLAQTYYYTSHSVRLLSLALSRVSSEDTELFSYFSNHINEESNHEKLALTDLKELGYDIDQFIELPSCRMLWETQYYKVEHIGAPALLGYIIVLESLAVARAKEVAKRVKNIATDSSSNRFMKTHGRDDIEHVEIAFGKISSLDNIHSAAILMNMEQTSTAYISMLEEILKVTTNAGK